MGSIREFLTQGFLPQRNDLDEPDGRLLYLYKCDDQEFTHLVDLLRESGAPRGYDFERYRKRWMEFREEFQSGGRKHDFDTFETTDLDWTIRGFVLYASEFWRRFRNEEWRQRSFPDGLPFRKLTWLQFLSLAGWTELYRKRSLGTSSSKAPNIVSRTQANATQMRQNGTVPKMTWTLRSPHN